MQYIDKVSPKNKENGHQFVLDFINGQWDDYSNRYVNLDYSTFRKSDFINLILTEQNFYCCYCMREISSSNATLEHIIPHKETSRDTFNEYLGTGGLTEDNLLLWSPSYNESQQDAPPFPHIIAYDNLVASCDGRFPENGTCHHCNGHRGNKKIIPLFLMENVDEIITYSNSGEILFDECHKSTIESLNLNYDTLRMMRKAWHEISSIYTTEKVIEAIYNKELRDEIIEVALIKLDFTKRLTLKTQPYWELFSKYKWFYNYYHNN